MKRFNPLEFTEIKAGKEYEIKGKAVQLSCSRQVALFITTLGVEACAGFAAAFEYEVSAESTFRVEADNNVRIFVKGARLAAMQVEPSEIFTNADRMPVEPLAITQMKQQHRALMDEMRSQKLDAMEAIRQERTKALTPPPEPKEPEVADPKPDKIDPKQKVLKEPDENE